MKRFINTLQKHFPRTPVTTGYLFDRVESHEWLVRLRDLNFFNEPPQVSVKPDGTPYMPRWPAAEFLKKMASKDPQTVASIIRKVPASGNVYVSSDLLEALINVPPELAANAANAVYAWLKEEEHVQFSEPWVDYLLHIGKTNQCEAAVEILRELLAITSDEKRSGMYSLKPLKLSLDDYYYSEIS